jgi:hypothetical protein
LFADNHLVPDRTIVFQGAMTTLRDFLKRTAAAAGIVFCGCGIEQ